MWLQMRLAIQTTRNPTDGSASPSALSNDFRHFRRFDWQAFARPES
jgi:hypothetical protein